MTLSSPTLVLSAPAKINLFLHITGVRPDGYHELQTAFQFLDFSDTITFDSRKNKKILLHDDLNIPLEQNLLWQAAYLLQSHTGVKQGVELRLIKRIPMGGGLGGGSSDAATVLVGLNQFWQTGLTTEQLEGLALQLGADVPIFVRGQSSWAEGVGQLLTPLDYPEAWCLVVIPPCHVNTTEVFAHPQLTRDTPRRKIADLLGDANSMRNDFELLVRKLYLPVDQAFVWLEQFARARLTGSGSCLFACFADEVRAQDVLQQLPLPYRGFIAKAMNRSPLYAGLDKMKH